MACKPLMDQRLKQPSSWKAPSRKSSRPWKKASSPASPNPRASPSSSGDAASPSSFTSALRAAVVAAAPSFVYPTSPNARAGDAASSSFSYTSALTATAEAEATTARSDKEPPDAWEDDDSEAAISAEDDEDEAPFPPPPPPLTPPLGLPVSRCTSSRNCRTSVLITVGSTTCTILIFRGGPFAMAWDRRCAPISTAGAARDGCFAAEQCGAILERCEATEGKTVAFKG